jgi:amino acid adenylation domain-containing protein
MTAARLIHDLLLQRARLRERDRIALTCDGQSYTFAQLLDASQRLATVLRTAGLQRGDRVVIFLDNSWVSAISIFGTLIAGGVFVLVSPQTKTEKLEFILRDSGAHALIAESRLEEIFLQAIQQLDRPVALLRAGHPTDPSDESLITAINAAEPLHARVPVIPLDLAAIIYTSGSTGNPKGVMQTHQSMVFTVGSIIEYLRLTRDDSILCVLPLSFDYGLYQLLMAVALGARLVLERSFTFLGDILARVRAEAITVVPGVPTIFASLVAAHRRTAICFPSVTRITNTAAALPEEFTGALREIFPKALIFKMYGLTECKRVSYLEPELLDAKPGSVGKAIPGTEVYLLSPDGRPVAPGEVGTLHVRGPHVMLGYWNQPDLTEQKLKPGRLPGERVLCTHDLFRTDSEGFLYFVGRTDEIIKTRGEKVSPVEVESALYRIPGVREAAVVGVPDSLLGEAIRAYVVTESTSGLTPQAIRAASAKYLELHSVPAQVILRDRLPYNPNGKIDRRQLLSESSMPSPETREAGKWPPARAPA